MEQQPPAAAATQTPTATPPIPTQEQAFAWASPPRPPFAHGGDDNASVADASTSTSTPTSDSSLAASYSRKLVELRALVADSHFRGKDLAGKGRRERGKKGNNLFRFSFFFLFALNPCSSPKPDFFFFNEKIN